MREEWLKQLREKAERLVARSQDFNKNTENLTGEGVEKMLHEIEVYHAELLAQNEELIRSQEELIESQDLYRALFVNAPVGYLIIDQDLHILEGNRKAYQMLGGIRAKSKMFTYLTADYYNPFLTWFEEKQYRESTLDIPLLRAGRENPWIELSGVEIQKDGKPCVQLSLQDISDRVKLRNHLKSDLEDTKEELASNQLMLYQQNKMAEMGEMISAIAHQWRNPLNLISMNMQSIALADVNTPDSLQKCVNNSMDQIHYLSDTIEVFRDFFKPHTEKQAFGVETEIRNTIKLLEASLYESSVNLELSIEKAVTHIGHANYFKQVLMNLIFNARNILVARDIPKKSIKIKLDFNESDQLVVVKVQDNGGGIDEDLLPDDLFQPYVTKSGKEGTGLGLFITKKIVEERFQGTISAGNIGEGAEFTLKFPVAATESAAAFSWITD